MTKKVAKIINLSKKDKDTFKTMDRLIKKFFGRKCKESQPFCAICEIWARWNWIKEAFKE